MHRRRGYSGEKVRYRHDGTIVQGLVDPETRLVGMFMLPMVVVVLIKVAARPTGVLFSPKV